MELNYRPNEAHPENRIIESTQDLKFLEIGSEEIQDLGQKLHLSIPQRFRQSGGVFIGPATFLHHEILAESIGLDPKLLDEDQKLALTETRYVNAGHLINQGGKSRLTGTSMTLSNLNSVPFAALDGTPEKKQLDENTLNRLREIYQGTWEFIL